MEKGPIPGAGTGISSREAPVRSTGAGLSLPFVFQPICPELIARICSSSERMDKHPPSV